MEEQHCSDSPLGQYLTAHGGSFHPNLCFRKDSLGLSVYATTALPPHAHAVTCPFHLAITPTHCRTALTHAFPSLDLAAWDDHALMTTYLSLHKLVPPLPPAVRDHLSHQVYVDTLPAPSDMRTPCWYTQDELALLHGSNLHGATLDRVQGWKDEWERVRVVLFVEEPERLTWELFLWACTILSSRAFPSSLITGPTSSIKTSSDSVTPILFPAVDTLNHRPGTRVLWHSDVHAVMPNGADPGALTIVLDEGVQAGEQAFNTYGAKPNEELLLGYGFVLPSNPADVVALLLPLPPPSPATASTTTTTSTLAALGLSSLRHFVPRSGVLPGALLAQLRVFLADEDEKNVIQDWIHEHGDQEGTPVAGHQGKGEGETGGDAAWSSVVGWLSWENELEMLDMLGEMLESKLAGVLRKPEGFAGPDGGGVRPDVRDMINEYRRGQVEILRAAVDYQHALMEDALGKAEAAGVRLSEDEDEEDDGDEQSGPGSEPDERAQLGAV